MENQTIISKTPLRNQVGISKSVFMANDDSYYFSGFGSGDSSSNSTQQNSEEKSGIGAGIFSGLFNIFGGLASSSGTIVSILPQLGIGKNARIKEAQAMAEINKQAQQYQPEADEQKSKQQQKLILIGGAMLLVLIVVIIALRS